MNKHLSLLTAALLLTGASSAFAASSTDLTVTGTITPVACEPTLANGGVVDYAKISVKDLNETTNTHLGVETIQLTVNCDASAQFAISTLDNRPNTSSSVGQMGLGLINGTEKLGYYQLGFKNPVADVPVSVMFSRNDGTTWQRFDDDVVKLPNDWIAFGNRISNVWTPEFVQNVTVDMWLSTAIAPTNSLTLTDEVKLDGNATLQIKYL
jgi:Protein of unknown function (DUF1120)